MPAERPGARQRDHQRKRIGPRQHRAQHDDAHQRDRGDQEPAQPFRGPFREQAGCGFDADQRVVFLVLMGIDRIVKQRPPDPGDIEDHGLP